MRGGGQHPPTASADPTMVVGPPSGRPHATVQLRHAIPAVAHSGAGGSGRLGIALTNKEIATVADCHAPRRQLRLRSFDGAPAPRVNQP